ncbi:MAG: N-carbamoyl-D-amino-acid hydrolase [Alphaproteobacteria bacterium]|nr:N-carbamoyl-D-amino-acid hydrolase [Alphaproteobacteria bacterium]
MQELVLAVAQMGPVGRHDPREVVVARLIRMLETAAKRGADLCVFPELALTTFFPRWMMAQEEVDGFFERTMPNSAVQSLFEAAGRLGVGFYLGYAELTPEGRHFNTAILVDKRGRILGKYRKVHLPGHAEFDPKRSFQHLERRYFEYGDLGFGVWDFHGAMVGMAICNDRRWPETYRVMQLKGAEVVVLGYHSPTSNAHFPILNQLNNFSHLLSLQGGAYSTCMYVAGAARCGFEEGVEQIGQSAIVDYLGVVVACTSSYRDEVIVHGCDLPAAAAMRAYRFPPRDRRPEHYAILTEIPERRGAQKSLPPRGAEGIRDGGATTRRGARVRESKRAPRA